MPWLHRLARASQKLSHPEPAGLPQIRAVRIPLPCRVGRVGERDRFRQIPVEPFSLHPRIVPVEVKPPGSGKINRAGRCSSTGGIPNSHKQSQNRKGEISAAKPANRRALPHCFMAGTVRLAVGKSSDSTVSRISPGLPDGRRMASERPRQVVPASALRNPCTSL